MYRVYIFHDMEHFTDADLETACRKVSPSRLAKAMGYVHSTDRKQSVIAELLLRHALSDACSIEQLPEISYGWHEKPMFKGAALPHFNLSHCSHAVACAVSDQAVGIDVEPYSSYNENVAREVFNDNELDEVEMRSTCGLSQALFAELWTKKESFLKYTGEGLTDNLKSLLAETGEARFKTFHSPRGYACSVCSHTIHNQTSTGDRDFADNQNYIDNRDFTFTPVFVDKTTLLDG